MAILTDISLWELFRHLGQWLTNLKRAGSQRQLQSIASLRAVVIAARHTQTYVRELRDTARQDHRKEAKLSAMWTELSFRLADLKLARLAKRCDIKGRYWADPTQFDENFLAKADVGLERMEQLARQLISEIESD